MSTIALFFSCFKLLVLFSLLFPRIRFDNLSGAPLDSLTWAENFPVITHLTLPCIGLSAFPSEIKMLAISSQIISEDVQMS